MNDLESTLGTALRDRTDLVQPDLDELAAASLRAGVRIRRRRRIGTSIGSAAAVAGVLGAVAIGNSLGGAPHAQSPGFATTAGSAAPSTPQHAGLRPVTGPQPMRHLTGHARSSFVHHLRSIGNVSSTRPPSGPYDSVLVKADRALSAAWTCGPVADDKFSCSGDGDFTVVARPKTDLAGWQIKGSVEAGQVAWIGKDCFLTVQGPTDHRLDIVKAKVAAAER